MRSDEAAVIIKDALRGGTEFTHTSLTLLAQTCLAAGALRRSALH